MTFIHLWQEDFYFEFYTKSTDKYSINVNGCSLKKVFKLPTKFVKQIQVCFRFERSVLFKSIMCFSFRTIFFYQTIKATHTHNSMTFLPNTRCYLYTICLRRFWCSLLQMVSAFLLFKLIKIMQCTQNHFSMNHSLETSSNVTAKQWVVVVIIGT